MHFPSLIQRACGPRDNITSHPDAAVGKINEAEIACLKDLNLNKLSACEFSAQRLHDWVTPPQPQEGFTGTIKHPPHSLLARHALTSPQNKLGP